MSLNYEMARYTELTGEDGTKVPISRLGGYLDGYEKGRADKYREITSEYMLLTETQVEEIRVDVIDDFLDWLLKNYCIKDDHMWDMEKEEILTNWQNDERRNKDG